MVQTAAASYAVGACVLVEASAFQAHPSQDELPLVPSAVAVASGKAAEERQKLEEAAPLAAGGCPCHPCSDVEEDDRNVERHAVRLRMQGRKVSWQPAYRMACFDGGSSCALLFLWCDECDRPSSQTVMRSGSGPGRAIFRPLKSG